VQHGRRKGPCPAQRQPWNPYRLSAPWWECLGILQRIHPISPQRERLHDTIMPLFRGRFAKKYKILNSPPLNEGFVGKIHVCQDLGNKIKSVLCLFKKLGPTADFQVLESLHCLQRSIIPEQGFSNSVLLMF
jgi:hypothetical protein